ncbi:hypothetical protein SCUP515_08646 [Seiridium cupressi]
MSAELVALQREFNAYAGPRSASAGEDDFINWLKTKRQDALNDWRRLRRRVAEEQLNANRQARETQFLELKYDRYYHQIGKVAADNATAPWKDIKEKYTSKCPKDGIIQKCPQPHCQRPFPESGSSIDHVPPLCGICAANLPPRRIARLKASKDTLTRCDNCKHTLCMSCGRGWRERQCRTCETVVGVPPTDKLAQTSIFCCWVCETDQDDRRGAKVASARKKGKERKSFRCGECTTSICVECAKPFMHKFDPDYGFVLNWWYKFIDNIWDPPEAHGGFEKYLRRERRLGIPQFNLEDLYTAPGVIDPDDDDTTLYDHVAPKKDDQKDDQSKKTTPPGLGNAQSQAIPMLYENNNIDTSSRIKRRRNARSGPDYRVRRVDFGVETPPPQGYEDFWYAENNRKLYDLASEWSETYFARRNLPEKYNDRTWFWKLNDQFIQYANLVAHEDSFFGPEFDGRVDGWEHIVKDRKNRKWLIMGILAQIIEKKIYVELLFGATPEESKQLDQQDSDNISKDGYQRAAARSQSINIFLGRKVVPDNFYQKVDELTAYAATIFGDIFALTNIMDEGEAHAAAASRSKIKARREDNLAFMYSELHFIIAHAAYLAVCMRRSSSIFHFLSATPSARMDYPIEGQASYELYKLSKEEYERREAAKTQEDKDAVQALETTPGRTDQQVADLKRDRRIAAHHRMRGAKVKFAVWPMVTRYRAENLGAPIIRPNRPSHLDDPADDHHWDLPSQDDVESGEGQRIIEIGKCVVVYYQGIIYPKTTQPGEPFESDGRTLIEYLESEKPNQNTETWKLVSRVRFAGRLAALALLTALYFQREWVYEHGSTVLTALLTLIAMYVAVVFLAADRSFAELRSRVSGLVFLFFFFGSAVWVGAVARATNVFGLGDVLYHLVTDSLWRWYGLAISAITCIVLPRTRNAALTVVPAVPSQKTRLDCLDSATPVGTHGLVLYTIAFLMSLEQAREAQ